MQFLLFLSSLSAGLFVSALRFHEKRALFKEITFLEQGFFKAEERERESHSQSQVYSELIIRPRGAISDNELQSAVRTGIGSVTEL